MKPVIIFGSRSALRPQTNRTNGQQAAVIALITSAALVLLALVRTDPRSVGDFGLVSAVPFYGLVGFVALGAVAVATIHLEQFNELLAGSAVATLVVAISAAPAIVYDTARFSWAFKHVGMVDFIDRTGGFDQEIDVLQVYHNWPGFFAGAASLTSWFGFDNAIVVAQWAPVGLNLMTLGGLVFLLGTLTTSRRTVWLGVLLFFATNWIGQDYFSPQAIAFILYLNIVALALRLYGRWATNRPAPAVHLVMVVLIFTMVASHQLTPLVLVVALSGLLVWRRTARVWIPLGAAVLGLVLWLGGWARTFVQANIADELSGVGSPVANAGETLSKAVDRNDAQVIVALAGRALVVGIVLVAMVGFLVRFWRGHGYRAPLVLLGAPLVMMVLEFGGEILFESYSSCSPSCVFWPPRLCAVCLA